MKGTILLADDSPTIRRLVTQTFADANYRIVEVNNGDAAIRSFEEVRPSIVLADIYMPGKNGYQVCAYIRSHSELSKTPVILLVGAFEAYDEDTAKQAGATASITKPFEPSALIALVKSALAGEVVPEAQANADPVETNSVRNRIGGSLSLESPEPKVEIPEPKVEQPAPVVQASAPDGDSEDLLGLKSIFKDDAPAAIGEGDIDRIAERVIQKISRQVVESIAWDVVPDITEKVVREELKRNQ
jgi:CheY-like chemotaxis protein